MLMKKHFVNLHQTEACSESEKAVLFHTDTTYIIQAPYMEKMVFAYDTTQPIKRVHLCRRLDIVLVLSL